jgi:succinyl-CoA---D-citramalate CoA-transferase
MVDASLGDGPFSGVRVIELGHALAGPFACSLLADLGAEVIKVERVGSGDDVRVLGFKEAGVGLWWTVTARNKKSVCLDLRSAAGLQVLRDLIAASDVFVENFRPGVVESMGLGWPDLSALNDQLIMLRVSGFGQTGPYSYRRGFGKVAEAFSGATNITGEAGQAPVHPGYSLADTVTGLMGAFGVAAALHGRAVGAGGQMIDLALYEGLLRMIEWQLPYVGRLGFNAKRNGGAFPFSHAYLMGIWLSLDGQYVAVSAATPETIRRIMRFLQARQAWPQSDDGEEPDIPGISAALEAWIAVTDAMVVLRELEDAGAVAGMVYDPASIIDDPHMRARESVIESDHPDIGAIPMPGIVPKFSETPGRIRHPAPSLGQHTEYVLRDVLGYSEERIAALAAEGAAQTAAMTGQP